MVVCEGHCPSGDDPRTAKVETDCYNVTATGSHYSGAYGNLCHVCVCICICVCVYATMIVEEAITCIVCVFVCMHGCVQC